MGLAGRLRCDEEGDICKAFLLVLACFHELQITSEHLVLELSLIEVDDLSILPDLEIPDCPGVLMAFRCFNLDSCVASVREPVVLRFPVTVLIRFYCCDRRACLIQLPAYKDRTFRLIDDGKCRSAKG